MTITTSNKSLIALINDYQSIDNARDLDRRKITLAELSEIRLAIPELNQSGATSTISDGLAQYYKKLGLSVTQDGVGWSVSL